MEFFLFLFVESVDRELSNFISRDLKDPHVYVSIYPLGCWSS